jgi:hypothetical protein
VSESDEVSEVQGVLVVQMRRDGRGDGRQSQGRGRSAAMSFLQCSAIVFFTLYISRTMFVLAEIVVHSSARRTL